MARLIPRRVVARWAMLAAALLVLMGLVVTALVTCGVASAPGTFAGMLALHGLGVPLVVLVVWIFWVGACHDVIGWVLWKRGRGGPYRNVLLRADAAFPEELADPSDTRVVVFKFAIAYPATFAVGIVGFHLLASSACP